MKNTNLYLTATLKNDVFSHAKKALPIEACGYLAGKDGVITTFYPMTNIDNSPEHFSFDPKEQFAIIKQTRAKNESILAVYHSHPETPARLSEEDIKLLNDPSVVYIIVSLKEATPSMKGYLLNKPDDNTIEITQVTLKETKEI